MRKDHSDPWGDFAPGRDKWGLRRTSEKRRGGELGGGKIGGDPGAAPGNVHPGVGCSNEKRPFDFVMADTNDMCSENEAFFHILT